MIDHAVPSRALTISPAFSWALSMALRITPTVAETKAQAKICGNRAEAAPRPSARVGSPPLKRIRAQLMRAALKNTITK